MLRRGARRPPQSTRARIPQKFGSGSVGSEMQPKPPFFPNPAQKKKKTRISTHTDVATVPARLGKSWPLAAREEPGPERGRCLRLAARGAAAGHHRSQVRRKCLASPARLNGRPGPASPRPRPGWSGRGRDLTLLSPLCVRFLQPFRLQRLARSRAGTTLQPRPGPAANPGPGESGPDSGAEGGHSQARPSVLADTPVAGARQWPGERGEKTRRCAVSVPLRELRNPHAPESRAGSCQKHRFVGAPLGLQLRGAEAGNPHFG
uniref:uncharacterized protein LOC110598403 n=1 Tax=Ictidomys tridecemlineatus TaxID=43179 RepID=UPI001A9EBA4C|nr:uncharacterized protein LOC110598403 [Ictidomys tridecemlineatus]